MTPSSNVDFSPHNDKSSGENGTTKKRKKQRTRKGKTRKWKVGDLCMATFSEDGELYEAKIKSINADGETCLIRFLGYEDEEQHTLNTLQPISSASQSESINNSFADETADDEGCSWMPHGESRGQIPVLAPPPPPAWIKTGSKVPSDQEALSSMLMAWYMSGYHTGYYQAQREIRAATNVGQCNVRRSNQPRGRPD